MGLFIQLGGFAASEARVADAVMALKSAHQDAIGEVGFYSKHEGRTLAFFGEYTQGVEEAVAAISALLNCPAFWFHIHDEDLWMYRLFSNGSEVDRFNTSPGYWTNIDAAERATWAGNASTVAEHWSGVTADEISRYLVDHQSPGFDGKAKAYESDQCLAWDCWQLIDFTTKLGLPYPPNDDE